MRSSLSALSSFPIVGPSLFSAEKVVQIAFRDDRCAWGFFFRAYSCLLLSTEYASPPASGPSARRWLWKGQSIAVELDYTHVHTHGRKRKLLVFLLRARKRNTNNKNRHSSPSGRIAAALVRPPSRERERREQPKRRPKPIAVASDSGKGRVLVAVDFQPAVEMSVKLCSNSVRQRLPAREVSTEEMQKLQSDDGEVVDSSQQRVIADEETTACIRGVSFLH